MDIVNNLEEAKEWFLSHSDGMVVCRKKVGNSTMEHVADTYPDAKRYYEEQMWVVIAELLEGLDDVNTRAVMLQQAIAEHGPVPDAMGERFRSILKGKHDG